MLREARRWLQIAAPEPRAGMSVEQSAARLADGLEKREDVAVLLPSTLAELVRTSAARKNGSGT